MTGKRNDSGMAVLRALSALIFVALVLAGAPLLADDSDASSPSAYFDTDRQMWLVDTDGDGVVDLTEELEGTDPLDPKSFLGSDAETSDVGQDGSESGAFEKVGFARGSCRSGFQTPPGADRLCIDQHEQSQRANINASRKCRDRFARVCTYEDLYYLYERSSLDASYNPNGMWVGGIQTDDIALCGNRSITFNNDPDRFDFEANCAKTTPRSYWCCHDRD